MNNSKTSSFERMMELLALCCDNRDLYPLHVTLKENTNLKELVSGSDRYDAYKYFLGKCFEAVVSNWLRTQNTFRTDFLMQKNISPTVKGRLDVLAYELSSNKHILPCTYSQITKNHIWNKYLLYAANQAEEAGHVSTGFFRKLCNRFKTNEINAEAPKDIFQVKYSEWPYYEKPLFSAYLYLKFISLKDSKSFPMFHVDVDRGEVIWETWLRETMLLRHLPSQYSVTVDSDHPEYLKPKISRTMNYSNKPEFEDVTFAQETDMVISIDRRPHCVVDAKSYDLRFENMIDLVGENDVGTEPQQFYEKTYSSLMAGPFHQMRSYMDHYSVFKGMIVYPKDDTGTARMQKDIFTFGKKKILFLGFSIFDYYSHSHKEKMRTKISEEMANFLNE